MTPFSRRLAAKLEQKFSRFANEWYLKWHGSRAASPSISTTSVGAAGGPEPASYAVARAHPFIHR